MVEVVISIQCSRWKPVEKNVTSWINNAVQSTVIKANFQKKLKGAALSVLLTNNKKMKGLNKNYRGKDKPTNVLSFPMEMPSKNTIKKEPWMLGDIVLAYETIAREAREQEKTLQGHVQHLTVHGLLHLLGHDHENNEEAEVMEALEIKILKTLGVDNPYKYAML
jgi:probable rRNA maturation factor